MHCKSLMTALQNAKKFNEMLMAEYTRMGGICHDKHDFEGRDHWNERYFQLACENEKIDMDIRKLKGELTSVKDR